MVRHVTIRTETDNPSVIAAALTPDNTEEMTTTIRDGTIVTEIERETTGGLRTTVDDYVTNLTVAAQLTNDTTNNHE
ncbi:KEOPS complex subunit Pcc1 [Halocatena salina]|uniref:KEOPS complex Pcc1-like subunit n=1 Tax=Halocatena salina TaxID=2934340 RepID=A0A8U0A4E8_9EURY|nr:KEOPS complex subunit Pcc1 [Halocatena salina]UPM43904.1 KEOPS complex Pcc1-like subunit [Halocatena salina]